MMLICVLLAHLILLCIAALNDLVDVGVSLKQEGVIASPVRESASLAVLDPVFVVGAIAAAFAAQRIERAIAEQAVELLLRHIRVAGKVFALYVPEKTEMLFLFHGHASLRRMRLSRRK